jgi:hypothetical protein
VLPSYEPLRLSFACRLGINVNSSRLLILRSSIYFSSATETRAQRARATESADPAEGAAVAAADSVVAVEAVARAAEAAVVVVGSVVVFVIFLHSCVYSSGI